MHTEVTLLYKLKYNGFSDRAPCTKLHKGEQRDRTKTLAEFPDCILNDYIYCVCPLIDHGQQPMRMHTEVTLLYKLKYNGFSDRAPCTKLHKGEQRDRTKTLAEFPDCILNDYI